MSSSRWTYAGLDASGQERIGELDASSETEAAKLVRTFGLTPLRLSPTKVPVHKREF